MGSRVFSQSAAWDVYDDWLKNGRATFLEEPALIERTFRLISSSHPAAAKDWADSYLSAFAQVSGLQLVTFDQALQRRTQGALLLNI
jgi:hypothetical protein